MSEMPSPIHPTRDYEWTSPTAVTYSCGECGAIILADNVELHDGYHDRQNEAGTHLVETTSFGDSRRRLLNPTTGVETFEPWNAIPE